MEVGGGEERKERKKEERRNPLFFSAEVMQFRNQGGERESLPKDERDRHFVGVELCRTPSTGREVWVNWWKLRGSHTHLAVCLI